MILFLFFNYFLKINSYNKIDDKSGGYLHDLLTKLSQIRKLDLNLTYYIYFHNLIYN